VALQAPQPDKTALVLAYFPCFARMERRHPYAGQASGPGKKRRRLGAGKKV